MSRMQLSSLSRFQEMPDWAEEKDLISAATACIEAQREAADEFYQSHFQPDLEAARQGVSEGSLRDLLNSGKDIHSIAGHREISNVIVFGHKLISDSIRHHRVQALREEVDRSVSTKIRQAFNLGGGMNIVNSGHFWYPPGSFMGWHTNSGAPGWRIYLSYAEEPGKSFFRYYDDERDELITSLDDQWSVRIFEIRKDRPLWHSVYSETHRFSLGYMIYRKSVLRSFSRLVRKLLKSG